MVISSLSVYVLISAQKKHIALDGSKCALGKIHNVQSQKVKYKAIAGVKFTKVCFKGKFTSKFQSTTSKLSKYFLTVHDRQRTLTDHLEKNVVAKSVGNIKIFLWHHLAAKITSGLNVQVLTSPKTRKLNSER
jgi:hypothetical protein